MPANLAGIATENGSLSRESFHQSESTKEFCVALRLALYVPTADHRLQGPDLPRLLGVAGPDCAEPAIFPREVARGVSVLVATLTGLGVIFGTTAHRDTLVRVSRLARRHGLVVAIAAVAWCRGVDICGISAVALGLNGLIVVGLARLLFLHFCDRYAMGRLLLIGLVAAGLLSGAVTSVLHLTRRQVPAMEAA